MRHTRPTLVVPSPVQRLPSRSKAMPFVPGTPVAKAVAVGMDAHAGAVESSESQPLASGATFHSVPVPAPSAIYRLPSASKVMPDGLQPVGFGMNATVTRAVAREAPDRALLRRVGLATGAVQVAGAVAGQAFDGEGRDGSGGEAGIAGKAPVLLIMGMRNAGNADGCSCQ